MKGKYIAWSKIIWIAILSLCSVIFYVSPVVCADFSNIKHLQWIDKEGRKPLSYKEYLGQQEKKGEFSCKTTVIESPKQKLTISIIIDSTLSEKVSAEFSEYQNVLIDEGYQLLIHQVNSGNYADIKQIITTDYYSGSTGAILIGDIPQPWFEMISYWGDYEQFPISLYYMDVNGNWADTDGDGLLDTHTGNVSPEIWVGYLNPHYQRFESESALLIDYFNKNEMYRNGTLTLPHRALCFNDDDWNYYGNAGLNAVYSNVIVIENIAQTCADEYLNQLQQGYEFVHIMAHSCPWSHTFKNGYSYAGCVSYTEIYNQHPQAFFYNLFNCSGTRFVEHDNIGNWYIFNDPYGLAAVGSAKTGSMLDFSYFYNPLGSGASFGTAFLDWFQEQAYGGFSSFEKSWFYGMNILGDPTLTVNNTSLSFNIPTNNQDNQHLYKGIQLTTNTDTDFLPSCASYNNMIYVAWVSGRNGRLSVYETHYNGQNWSPQVDLTGYEYWEMDPIVIIDNSGQPHIFFAQLNMNSGQSEYDIIHCYRQNQIWYNENVTNDVTGYCVQPTAIVDNDGNLWVAWQSYENGNADVMAKYYNGSTWSNAEFVASSLLYDGNPCLTKAPYGTHNVLLVWDTKQNNTNNIYYAFGNCFGWTPGIALTNDSDNNTNPVAIYNDISEKIELVWTYENNNILRIREANYSQDNGWTQPIDLFENILPTQKIFLPQLTAANNETFLTVTVEDNIKNVHFYNMETCEHWTIPSSDTDQWQSDITVFDDELYCFWQSNEAGNNDIYYQNFCITKVDDYPLIKDKILLRHYPNPLFNNENGIVFQLYFGNKGSENLNEMSLQIFNIKGQLIKTILYSDFIAKHDGLLTANWNVKDNNGMALSSGVYLYKLNLGNNNSKTQKMLIVK